MQGWRVWVGLAFLASARPAAATEDTAKAQQDATEDSAQTETELGLIPLLGGDTDVGFGGGFLGTLARVGPGVVPFLWRVEAGGFITFKSRESGFESPYRDVFVSLTLPGLFGGRLRLDLRPSYTRESNLRYYGLGNASVAPEETVPVRDFYTRSRPTVVTRARVLLDERLSILFGVLYSRQDVEFSPVSNLARDLFRGSPTVKRLLNVQDVSNLLLLEAGILFDTRDDEIAPAGGQFHQLKFRVCPGLGDFVPYQYAQFSAIARGYLPVIADRLMLAGRVVGDLQVGDVPFFELSRYEETSAIGGANGVRGVPSDRYYGKVKLFGNFEARLHAWAFRLWGSEYRLGAAGFVDAGRVWADTRPTPSLDGDGLGIKYGIGGGVRVQKGRTFVLRADAAWSPDARPIGLYLLGGHLF